MTALPRRPPAIRARQDLLNLIRNSGVPWFWVVTRLPKLGFGMFQLANVTGMEPEIVMPAAVRLAERLMTAGSARALKALRRPGERFLRAAHVPLLGCDRPQPGQRPVLRHPDRPGRHAERRTRFLG